MIVGSTLSSGEQGPGFYYTIGREKKKRTKVQYLGDLWCVVGEGEVGDLRKKKREREGGV